MTTTTAHRPIDPPADAPSPTPRRTRMPAELRRAEVIEAAVQAFGSGGYAGTSTEEIARLAGVSQPYLFRLFGTKQDLFIAAVDRAFERIRIAFEEGARHPVAGLPADVDPVLAGMGRAYSSLLRDTSLLRLQLHAFAACDDPTIRAFVRREFAALVRRVAEVSGVAADDLRLFFAEGMLLNVAAAMELTEAEVAWQLICEEGSA